MARFVREGTIFLRQFDVIMCPLYNKGFSEVIYLYSYDRPCQLANVLTKMFNGGFYSIDWDEAFILQGVFFIYIIEYLWNQRFVRIDKPLRRIGKLS